MRTPTLAFYIENLRWLAAGFLLTFCSSFGQTFFISLFAGEFKALHGLTDGAWGSLYTVATLASAAVLFQAGGLADRVRLDRLAMAVLGAYALVALGIAAAGPLWLLGLLVFGLRLCGQGMMGHIAITAMGRWFRARRGSAVAFAGLGFSAGEALLPVLVVAAMAALGWQGAWLAVAGLLLFVMVPLAGWLLAEGRRPQTAAADGGAPGMDGRHWTRAEAMGDWTFWALMPAVLTPSFIGTVIFFHQVHIATVKGWDLGAMALGFPLYAALTVTAALIGGALVDRMGPARLLPVFLLPMAAGTAVLGLSGDISGWFAALALAGLTQGLAQTLWGALWPELYGTRHLGRVRAGATTAMVFATAAGPGITGLLIDAGIDFPSQTMALALWASGVAALGLFVLRGLGRRGGLDRRPAGG